MMMHKIFTLMSNPTDNSQRAKRGDARMGYLRTLPVFAGILLAGSVLASCGSLPGNDHMTTGSVENDYRARHPINLSEAEHTLDVPVASGDVRLSLGVRDSIRGFGSAYQGSSSGVVQIVLPVGSVNSAAAMAAKREIRGLLQQSGVSPVKSSRQVIRHQILSKVRPFA